MCDSVILDMTFVIIVIWGRIAVMLGRMFVIRDMIFVMMGIWD